MTGWSIISRENERATLLHGIVEMHKSTVRLLRGGAFELTLPLERGWIIHAHTHILSIPN